MNYYQHHIGDYSTATKHLSLIEDAIYMRLLWAYYRDEKPLPDDLSKIAWMVGVRTKKEKSALALLLETFFVLQADGWHNLRADKEIAHYQSNKETAQENGKKGGRPKTKGEPADNPGQTKGKPDENPTETQAKPNPNPEITQDKANQQPITNITTTAPPLTPRKRGASFDAAQIALPVWLNSDDWQAWIADRKARKKPVTAEGAKRQIEQLDAYRKDGYAPSAVIAHSIAGGYQGLYPPRPSARASPTTAAQRRSDWNERLSAALNDAPIAPNRPHIIDMGTIHETRLHA